MSSRAFVLLAGILASLLGGCGGNAAPVATDEEHEASRNFVRIAAASDLKFAMDELLAAFREAHPRIETEVVYGSSGNFYAQLSNRAPFDIFFSADVEYPRKLIEQGLAVPESEFLYALGHIVVWVPNESSLNVQQRGMETLRDPSARKIAMANPRFAPYGRAAEAALRNAGVYEQIRERLVLGDNIAQTAQFVETGAADAGIIALSLARAPALRDKGRYWEIPLDAHPPIEQGGVILNWARDPEAAEALRAFVLGPDGKAILRKHSFYLPEG